MDPVIAAVVVVAIVAIVIIVLFVIYRRSGGVEWKLPFGMNVKMGGSNQAPPATEGMTLQRARSHKGSIKMEDDAGGVIKGENLEAEQDISLKRSQPGNINDPKA